MLACLQVDAGVADQLVLGDPTAPRFVYWDKKLRPTPSGEHPASQTVSQPASQPACRPARHSRLVAARLSMYVWQFRPRSRPRLGGAGRAFWRTV